MKKKILFGYLFLFLILSACNNTKEETKDDSFVIYTSIYPIQYVTEQILGEKNVVKSIYPPGVDAHTYEPTSKEITEIAKGDVFIYLGAGMESFAESTAEALASQDVLFIELGTYEHLFFTHDKEKDQHHEEKNEEDHHDHGDLDPHIWLDPLRMIKIGEIIKEELTELTPKLEKTYNENFAAFEERMQQLDEEFTETLAQKENKQVIVSHAAYGYWEERYGIEQIPISGLSSSDEPSQKDLTEIARLAEKQNINTIIFEQTGSNRLATIIQEYISAEKLTLHNLEVLTESDIENEEDYLSLMKQNLQVLDQATN